MKRNSKDISGATFLWFLFFGYPIVLSISMIFNIHFKGLASLSIIFFFFILAFSRLFRLHYSVHKRTLSFKWFLFFGFCFLLILLSIILSSKYGTPYWLEKVGITLVYFVLPTSSVIFFYHDINNRGYYDSFENIIFVLVLLSILIGFFYIYKFGSIYSNAYYMRLAGNSNSIDFSYAFVSLFLFLGYYTMKKMSRILSFLFLIIGLIISILTGTRQVVAYTLFFIFLFTLYFLKKKRLLKTILPKKPSINNRVLIILILFLIFLFVKHSYPYFTNMYNWAMLRWKEISIQGRVKTYINALNVFESSPIFGCFAYETQGFWAHNTILDVLAQFGLISAIIYAIILVKATLYSLRIIFKGENGNILVFFAIYFISSLSMALTVSDFLFNPAFNFTMTLLFLLSIRRYKKKANKGDFT